MEAIALFLVIICLSPFLSVKVEGQTPVLTCKRCNRVSSLEQCTTSVICSGDEVCYMDEIITPELSIVYTSGCRSKIVCGGTLSSEILVGKRNRQRRDDLIACSRCCDTVKKPGQLDCNARLCGIKYANTLASRCYLCDSRNSYADQGNVDRPIECLSETSCQSDEACGVQRVDISGRDEHIYDCLPKRLCTLLTHEVLYRKEECEINPDPKACTNNNAAGKRASTTLCTACCGDGLCNSGSCEQVIDRLYALWKGGVLDFNTLRQNGSLVTTLGPIKTTVATQPQSYSSVSTTSTAVVTTLKTTPTTPTTLKTTTPTTLKTTPTTLKTTTQTTATIPTTLKTTTQTTATTPTTLKTTTPTKATTPSTLKTTTPTKATTTTLKTTTPTTATISTTLKTPPPTTATRPTTLKTTTPTTATTTTTLKTTTPTTATTTTTLKTTTPTTATTTTTLKTTTPTTATTPTTLKTTTPTTATTTTTFKTTTPTTATTSTTLKTTTPTTATTPTTSKTTLTTLKTTTQTTTTTPTTLKTTPTTLKTTTPTTATTPTAATTHTTLKTTPTTATTHTSAQPTQTAVITSVSTDSVATSGLSQSPATLLGQTQKDASGSTQTVPVPSSPDSASPSTIHQPNTTALIG